MSSLSAGMVAIFTATAALGGCAPLKQWWGEAPEQPGVIQLPSSSVTCPDPMRVLEGDEIESEKTFECIVAQVEPLWSQIDGKEKSALTDQELAILVRKGAIDSGGEPEKLLQKIYAAKKLLGLGSPLKRTEVDQWISLLRAHRSDIRLVYAAFSSGNSEPLNYARVKVASRIAEDILREMNWSMDSEQLVVAIRQLFDISSKEIRNGLRPAARAAVNLLNAICPTFSSHDFWNTREIGACLVRAVDHFEMGEPWFDFVANPDRSLTDGEIRSIRLSLDLLEQQFDSWFHQKELQPMRTGRLIDLARSLGLEPPADILSALDLIKRFHPRSNGNEVDPTAFSGLFSLVRRYQVNVLQAVPFFVRAADSRRCVDETSRFWTDCVPVDLEEIRAHSGVVDLAMRVANPRHGAVATPFNGSRVAKIMAYHVLSGKIIEAFDEDHKGVKDGLISASARRGKNEVARLITVGLSGYETLRGFMDNMVRRWKSEPLEPQTDGRIMDLAALAQVITMSHDVLVERTPQQRNALESVISNLLNAFPGSSMFLDQLSVTAVIVLADELTDYRAQYLRILPQTLILKDGLERGTVLRSNVRAALPELLRLHFPRTHDSCIAFGFDASCGMAFDEILPSATADHSRIFVNDLDLLTIAAVAMEGLVDTCDVNGDGRLSWDLLDGKDELDCGFVRIKDILKRLIDADVIHASTRDKILANVAIETVNSTFATRVIGKMALVRGTKRHIVLHWPLFWAYNHATIGSMFGLVADVIDADAAKQARKEAKRERRRKKTSPVASAG